MSECDEIFWNLFDSISNYSSKYLRDYLNGNILNGNYRNNYSKPSSPLHGSNSSTALSDTSNRNVVLNQTLQSSSQPMYVCDVRLTAN